MSKVVKILLFLVLLISLGIYYRYIYLEYCAIRYHDLWDFIFLGSGYASWKPYKDLGVISMGLAISVTVLLIGVIGFMKKKHFVDYLLVMVGVIALLVPSIQLLLWVLSLFFRDMAPES